MRAGDEAGVPGHGDDVFGVYDVRDFSRWNMFAPQPGNVLVTAVPYEVVGQDNVEGFFLVLGSTLASDASMLVQVRAIGASRDDVVPTLSSLFNRRAGALHICLNEGPCAIEEGVFHVRRLELWNGSEFPSGRLTVAGRKLLKQVLAPGGTGDEIEDALLAEDLGEVVELEGSGKERGVKDPLTKGKGGKPPGARASKRKAPGEGQKAVSGRTAPGILRDRLEKVRQKQQNQGLGRRVRIAGEDQVFEEDGDASPAPAGLTTSSEIGTTREAAGARRAGTEIAVREPREGIMKNLRLRRQQNGGVVATLTSQAAKALQDKKRRPRKKKDKALDALKVLLGGKKRKKKKKKEKKRKRGDDPDGGDSGDSSGSSGEDEKSGSCSESGDSSEEEKSLLPPLKKKSERAEGSVLELLITQIEQRLNELGGAAEHENPVSHGLALPDPLRRCELPDSRRSRVVLDSQLHRPVARWPTGPAGGCPRGSLAGPRASGAGPELVRCPASRNILTRPCHSGGTGGDVSGQEVFEADGEGHRPGQQVTKQQRRQRRCRLGSTRSLAGKRKARQRQQGRQRRPKAELGGQGLPEERPVEQLVAEAEGAEGEQFRQGRQGKGGVMERHLKRSWLDKMLASAGDLSALGLSMYFELFRSPAIDGGRPWHYFRAFAALKKVCFSSGRLSRVLHSKRQVFPLPSFVFPILSNVGEFSDFESFVKGAQCRAILARACWCELVVLFANHSGCGNATRACSRPTAVQRDLMSSIRAAVDRILMDDSHVLWGVSEIKEDFQKRTVSYSGEEICKAEALSLARIKPGLPPEGHGGSIEAVKWVGGRTRELLLNPLGCLCPDVGQDLPRLQGKVHIVREEALTVAMELVRRGICRWTHSSEVVTYRGQKVLNGLFGVPKSKLLESGESVLRVIMNLVPINSVLRVIPGRVAKLPNITQWLNVVLEEGETVRLAQSDMTCAFYLLGMPIEWSRLLCFNLCFDSSTLGVEARSNSEDKWYLSCAVLPMGWSSAVGVMQEIAESVLLQGGLDDQGQIHKTCPLPSWMINSTSEGMRQGRPWWHVYLDNFAGGAKVVEEHPKELIELQRSAEALWGEAGIVVSADKSVVAAESGVELGAFIGGSGQWIGASCERMIKIIKSTLWLIHQPSISKKKLQIVMGRWCFALQFRRPGMCQFDAVWAYISSKRPRARQIEDVRQELL